MVVTEGGGISSELVVELGLEVEDVLWIAFEGVREGDGGRSSCCYLRGRCGSVK